jgi:hypothetical protein
MTFRQFKEPAPEEEAVSAAVHAWATGLLFGYFILRLVYFALCVPSFVPPDEVTHAGLCHIFSRVLLLPGNGPGTYEFGLVTNIPWLYYWTMGKLLHLNVFGLSDLVFLRLLNLPIACATVWYAVRLLRLLTRDRLTGLLLLAVMTNTAMFSFLSASVSYDNLVNLLAVMAIYYLLAFFRQRAGALLAASLLCQLAGGLTKITMLPLILVLNLLFAIWAVRQWRPFVSSLRGYLAPRGRALWQVPLILVALGLNLQLYAGNYLRFGTLAATMPKVLTPELSMQNRIGAREEVFSLYESGKISYMDALQMAGDIRHPGDKADTFYLLMNYENLRAHPANWLGPVAYAKIWFQQMTATIFGIKGHLQMFKNPRQLIPIYLVLALALAGAVLRWRPREQGWLTASLAAVSLFYAGVLLVKVNYPAYSYYGNPGITLQGRYLFPVLAPIYVLGSLYLVRLFRARALKLALALGTALLCLVYDFPWFLAHATAGWLAWLPK